MHIWKLVFQSFLVLCLSSAASAVNIYYCKIGDSVAIQDVPCGGGYSKNTKSSEKVSCPHPYEHYVSIPPERRSDVEKICLKTVPSKEYFERKARLAAEAENLEREKQMAERQRKVDAEIARTKRIREAILKARAAGEHIIEYQVIGNTLESFVEADITYRNAQGGTEQRSINEVWRYYFRAKKGFVAYISAQSDTYSDLHVKIYVDNILQKQSTVSDRHAIATASGRL